MAEYNGVDVDHPALTNAAKNMIRQGHNDEKIMKVVGIPLEVVQMRRKDVEREDKAK